MSVLKCPKCGSSRLYHEISVYAKQSLNTGRIYDVDKNNPDGSYELAYCEKCGWCSDEEGKNYELRHKYGDWTDCH